MARNILILFDIDNTLVKDGGFTSLANLFLKYKLPNNLIPIRLMNRIKKKATIGIWSQGFKKVQIMKLKTAKIFNYIDPDQIWISHQKMRLLNKINNQDFKKIYIVDDKQRQSKYPKIIFIKAPLKGSSLLKLVGLSR